MAKNYFLNHPSHLHQKAKFLKFMAMQIRKPENEGIYFFQVLIKKKMQEKNKGKIKARFAERKQKINSLKIKC